MSQRVREQENHFVRVCLCVSQPCACLCLFLGTGIVRRRRDLPRPQGRRASHIPRPSTPPLSPQQLGLPRPCSPPAACSCTDRRCCRDPIFRRTVCQRCLWEDVVARMRHSFFELCLSSSTFLEVGFDLHCRGPWSTIRFPIEHLSLPSAPAVSEARVKVS